MAGKSKVREATRKKVLEAAEKLGYRPNVAASLLSSRKRGAAGRLTVASVTQMGADKPEFSDACRELGLDGSSFRFSEFSGPREMLRVLWSRGFEGLLLDFMRSPWPEEDWAGCRWENFSVVKMNRLFAGLPFHLVRHSAFDYLCRALGGVLASGAKNVAVLLPASGSEDDDLARLGAVLAVERRARGEGCRIRWRIQKHTLTRSVDPDSLPWLRRIGPDAILSFGWVTWYGLRDAGWRFPENGGFAAVMRPGRRDCSKDPEVARIAGCEVFKAERYLRALGHLRTMIGNNERGFTTAPTEHVIEPRWIAGESLPQIPGSGDATGVG